jgi:DNA-binding transcriptional LysR family regulator
MLGVRVERALAFMEIAERNISTLRVSYRKPSQFYKKATRRQLITLLSVYDNNSVSNAARDLCISQPSVTMTLRELEKLIGANLFSRHSKGLLPTEAGEILVKHVKLAMSEIRAAAVDFALIAGGNATHIKIGVLPLAGQIELAPV